MALPEKKVKRVNRMMEFNEKHPDKYCWSDLYEMAVTYGEERLEHKEQAKNMYSCKRDIEINGSCWCGKFQK